MTPERKVERIIELFRRLAVVDMTTLELQIHEVINDKEATPEQKGQARSNASTINDG